MLARCCRLAPLRPLRRSAWSTVSVECRKISSISTFQMISRGAPFTMTNHNSCVYRQPFNTQYRTVINISYGDDKKGADSLTGTDNNRHVKVRYFALSTLEKVCAPEVFNPIIKLINDFRMELEENSLLSSSDPASIKKGLENILELHNQFQQGQKAATVGLDEFVDLCSLSVMCIENDLQSEDSVSENYDVSFHTDFVQRLNDISERASIAHFGADFAFKINRDLVTEALTLTDNEAALSSKVKEIQQTIDGHCSSTYNETIGLLSELSELMLRYDNKHDLTEERMEASIQKILFEKPINGNVEEEDQFQEFCQEEMQRWQDNHPECAESK